jgi:hypothetical protein
LRATQSLRNLRIVKSNITAATFFRRGRLRFLSLGCLPTFRRGHLLSCLTCIGRPQAATPFIMDKQLASTAVVEQA